MLFIIFIIILKTVIVQLHIHIYCFVQQNFNNEIIFYCAMPQLPVKLEITLCILDMTDYLLFASNQLIFQFMFYESVLFYSLCRSKGIKIKIIISLKILHSCKITIYFRNLLSLSIQANLFRILFDYWISVGMMVTW